jgi:short-chain fatty acids transporter
MRFAERFERTFKWLLPSPFAIALGLTALTFLAAAVWGDFKGDETRLWQIISHWEAGLWNPPLLVFMVQMLLILVFGHALALSPLVNKLINKLLNLSKQPALSTALVCFFTLVVAFFNWGLGLVFGAIMARKTAEKLSTQGQAFNYGLIGAAGYSGLMVWHGGISGSAPLKVAEQGHLLQLAQQHLPQAYWANVPQRLGFESTIFSPMNLSASLLLLILLPALTYFIALKAPQKTQSITASEEPKAKAPNQYYGAEKLDYSNWLGTFIGVFILGCALYLALPAEGWQFINPNFINFCLLGLGLSLHGSLHRFTGAVHQAIGGATGIVTQFPLYFGIMALMGSSGLILNISQYFSAHATAQSFPVFTFFSAGLVNIFVPSGGGQWAIQGPVLIQTAQNLGIPLGKAVMALAYGDQLTNMLQPFWALPLLGITGLKAREIIPYSLLYLVAGGFIFLVLLMVF